MYLILMGPDSWVRFVWTEKQLPTAMLHQGHMSLIGDTILPTWKVLPIFILPIVFLVASSAYLDTKTSGMNSVQGEQ